MLTHFGNHHPSECGKSALRAGGSLVASVLNESFHDVYCTLTSNLSATQFYLGHHCAYMCTRNAIGKMHILDVQAVAQPR
jgi:hypothetical protein